MTVSFPVISEPQMFSGYEVAPGDGRYKNDHDHDRTNTESKRPATTQSNRWRADYSQLPGKAFEMNSCSVFVTLVKRSTLARSASSAFTTRRFCSRIWLSCAATSPGSSTRCLIEGSGSSALRLISSRRSGRPRRNLWWENSHVCASVEVRCARGVCGSEPKDRTSAR